MKKLYPISLSFAIAVTAAVMFTNCSPASSGSTAGGGGGSSLSEFATVLSEDMVLTSPTAQRTGTSILGSRYFMKGDVMVMAAPGADDSPKEKKDALEDLLADTAPASCAIALNVQNSGRANCYGPSVAWTNHEFDNLSGSWLGGDLGIWEDSEASGEACVAAQLTQQMKGVISYADSAQFIGAGIACVANKKGSALPATAGVQLDLTADMAGIVTINSAALTVALAQIERIADDASGNPVYVTTMNGTAGGVSYEIRIKHVSTATDDSTNMGKISVKVDNGTNSTNGISLEYVKASATSGKFLLRKTNFAFTGIVPFVSGSDYSVNFNHATPWNNADYFIAEIDPTKYTGKFAYAWQAGAGDSHTRVFNAILSEAAGVVTGSAFFGFGPTMQTGPGAIDGMICAWTGPEPGPAHTPVAKVQRQDMTLTGGKFVLTGTSATVFDPVQDCEAIGTMAMSWSTSSTRTVASTTENLRPLGEVASTVGALPSAPVNVD